jgi:hypothetical protein
MDGGDEYVTETLKMVINVFWCSGDESSRSIITSCLLTMHLRTHYLKTLDLVLSEYIVELILMLFTNTLSAININQT